MGLRHLSFLAILLDLCVSCMHWGHGFIGFRGYRTQVGAKTRFAGPAKCIFL